MMDRGKGSAQTAVALAFCGVLLGGCVANLQTYRLGTNPGSGERLPAGFPYRLPVAEVIPAAQLVLTSCPDPKNANETKRRAGFRLVGSVTAEQKPGPLLILDYRSLSAFNKTGSLAITRHPNGMLKTVNAGSEDRSAEMLAAMAAVAANVALLATAGPAALAAGAVAAASAADLGEGRETGALLVPKTRQVEAAFCTNETRKLLSDGETARVEIARLTREIGLETDRLNLLRFQLATGGVAEEQRKKIEQAITALAVLQGQLAKQLAALSEIVAALSLPLAPKDRQNPAITADGRQFEMMPAADAVTAFMNRHFLASNIRVPTRGSDPETVAALRTRMVGIAKVLVTATRETGPDDQAIDTALGTSVDARSLDAKRNASLSELREGLAPARGSILYYEPAHVRFRMTGSAGDPAKPVELAASLFAIPQAGHLLALPVRSGFGEKSVVSASFREDGSLVEARFERSASGGSAAAGLAQSMSELAVNTRIRRLEMQAKAIELQTNELARRKAAAAEEASRSEAARQQAALDAERIRIEAELAIAKARAELTAIQAPRPAG